MSKLQKQNRLPRLGACIAVFSVLGLQTQLSIAANAADDAVTYSGQVAKIINENCVVCHREGGIGPMLAGQAGSDIVAKLTAYRAGEERGAQSAMMYPVAKPMTDADIDNLAAYVSAL